MNPHFVEDLGRNVIDVKYENESELEHGNNNDDSFSEARSILQIQYKIPKKIEWCLIKCD